MTENTELTSARSAGSSGSNLQAMQRRQYETVHCLLLPLNKEFGLLPNASVAEIIPFTQLEVVEDAPEWILGMLTWRDRRLPVISFELASEGEAGRYHKSCRIAIINTLNGNAKLPYFGMLVQSLPSLQIVRPTSIEAPEDIVTDRPSIKALAIVNGTPAIIPDLDDLEQRLIRLLKST